MLKRIFYVSTTILRLALACHLGAAKAQSQPTTNAAVAPATEEGQSSLSAPASANDVPDSSTLLRLRNRIGPRSLVKAIGTFGTLDLRSVALASDGLSGQAAHPTTAELTRYEGRIPWTEVSELRVRRSALESGLTTGAAAGVATVLTLVGVVLITGNGFDSETTSAIGRATVICVTSGALIGAVIGAPLHHWKTVYRSKAASSVGPPLRIMFADRNVIEVMSVEPWGHEMLRIVALDGRVSYLAASRVHEIRDARGTDWTVDVLQKRRRLPR